MAKPRKFVSLTGKRKRMQTRCRRCGECKQLEYRKNGKERRIYGASELTPASPAK